jgi:hypothetical protein
LFKSIYLLGGDSDAIWELPELQRARLPGLFAEWIELPLIPDIEDRLEQLDARLPCGDDVVLLGRSSGARVATHTTAPTGRRAASSCLSYPFRRPNWRLEPERFSHLAELAVPTLILQGIGDDYGGLDVTEHCTLSPSVSLRFIDGDHGLAEVPARLDVAAPLIRAFCEGVSVGQAFPPARFDEAFYRRTHARAAREIAAGRYRSERLAFRLLPEPA